MTVVYLDRVFLLNSVVDYLLFLCAARLCGFPLHRRRLIFARCWAAFTRLRSLFPSLHFWLTRRSDWPLEACWRLPRFAVSARSSHFLLSAALAGTLLALGLAFGSVAGLAQRLYYADVSWQALILVSILFYVLLRLFAGQAARHGGGELLQIKVSVGGRIQTVTALHDTGNTLRDPVTGCPALVMERRSADALWTPAVADVLAEQLSPEEKMAKLHRIGCPVRFTLMPFRAVGTAAGLLLAACSDYIEVNGKRYPRTPVALSEQAVSDGGGYHALWGAMEGRIGHGKASDLAETPVAQRIQAG